MAWQSELPAGRELAAFDATGKFHVITPHARKRAIAEVQAGLTFCLSLPATIPRKAVAPSSARRPRTNAPDEHSSRPLHGPDLSGELVALAPRYSTPLESLAHLERASGMSTESNGELPCGDHTGPLGVTHLAENGLQGRGVMIDLRHHLGPGRHAVGYYTLMRIIDADDIAVEPGDILCLYSGFGDILLAAGQRSAVVQMRPARCAELDGRDERLLRWIKNPTAQPSHPTVRPLNWSRRAKFRTHHARNFPCTSSAFADLESLSAASGTFLNSPGGCERITAGIFC
jgi:hypothetical protein